MQNKKYYKAAVINNFNRLDVESSNSELSVQY